MKVSLSHPNTAMISIIKNPDQVITLDANFLIPPDRRPLTRNCVRFEHFKKIWLDPI